MADLVTTAQVLANYRRIASYSRVTVEGFFNLVLEMERNLLAASPLCGAVAPHFWETHIYSIELDQLEILLQRYFYDPTLMRFIFCLIQSIIEEQHSAPATSSLLGEKIRSWLTDLKRLGAPSAFGKVYGSNLQVR